MSAIPIDRGRGTKNSVELITPAKAEQYLNRNNVNRTLRDGRAEAMAADMAAGRWTECVAPIVFYEDGYLADGQHRLWAVILSGTSHWFDVKRGLKRESGLNIDTGLSRSLVDNARISGVMPDLTAGVVAAARAIAFGTPNVARSLSLSEQVELMSRFGGPARWAFSNVRHVRGLCNSAIVGAVGRAHLNGVDATRLARYCDVLGTGFYEGDGETAAQAMRSYLLRMGSTSTHASNWRDTFLKTMNSIAYFTARKKLTVIKSVDAEAYPLPRGMVFKVVSLKGKKAKAA